MAGSLGPAEIETGTNSKRLFTLARSPTGMAQSFSYRLPFPPRLSAQGPAPAFPWPLTRSRLEAWAAAAAPE